MATLVSRERDAKPPMVGVRYCRSCWRRDVHQSALEMPHWLRRGLNLATLGLLRRIEPARCACCGTLRVF